MENILKEETFLRLLLSSSQQLLQLSALLHLMGTLLKARGWRSLSKGDTVTLRWLHRLTWDQCCVSAVASGWQQGDQNSPAPNLHKSKRLLSNPQFHFLMQVRVNWKLWYESTRGTTGLPAVDASLSYNLPTTTQWSASIEFSFHVF